MTIAITPPASLLTDFDQLDIAEAIRNAVAHDATSLTARDRQALTLLTYVPGLHGGTRALAHVLAEDRVALPLPTDLAMALLDVIGDDDLLGPEPEWDVQEAWLAARKPTSTTGEVMKLRTTVLIHHVNEFMATPGNPHLVKRGLGAQILNEAAYRRWGGELICTRDGLAEIDPNFRSYDSGRLATLLTDYANSR